MTMSNARAICFLSLRAVRYYRVYACVAPRSNSRAQVAAMVKNMKTWKHVDDIERCLVANMRK